MGMPIITAGTGSRNQSITDMIQSVALQEAAISHILNAEGEKIQAIIAMPDTTPEQLLALNSSVNKMVDSLTYLEMMFVPKLELVLNKGSLIEEENPIPPVTTSAAEELSRINVLEVWINVPLDDADAAEEAAREAVRIAQEQVADGYIVAFTPTGYYPDGILLQARAYNLSGSDTIGLLTGRFTVINAIIPADSATDTADRSIDVLTTATTAADQLARLDVTIVEINIALDDPAAQAAAVKQAIADAQAQVAPGYTVSFVPETYVAGLLTGRFTVFSNTDPLDKATDAADRSIEVVSNAVTAQSKLALLAGLNAVTIDVALDDATAQQAAIDKAIADAQLIVGPDFTVSFADTNYTFDTLSGLLIGSFTVKNNSDATDTATDGADRSITVTTTAVTASDKLALLAGLNAVTINVALDDATAQQAAIDKAIADAQTIVGPDYTVSFASTGYTYGLTAGQLTGSFTVVSKADATDTATDNADRNITVTSTATVATMQSNASAQFLSGSLLTGDLSAIANIAGMTEHYENGVDTPGVPNAGSAGLDLSLLGGTVLNLANGLSLPLGDILALGVANQYASAAQDGVSFAYAGGISDGGVINVGAPGEEFPANATIHLLNLLSVLDPNISALLGAVDLTTGLIVSRAYWDAQVTNAPGETITQVTNAAGTVVDQGRGYNLDSMSLEVDSPLIGDVVTGLTAALDTLGTDVLGLGTQAVDALLGGFDAVTSILEGIPVISTALLIPGTSLGISNKDLKVDLSFSTTDFLNETFAPINESGRATTIDLVNGIVSVDLKQLILNNTIDNLAPNTHLLSGDTVASIITDLTALIDAVGSTVTNLPDALFGSINVNISGSVGLDVVTEVASLEIVYSGSLRDLLTGIKVPTITVTAAGIPVPGLDTIITSLLETLLPTFGSILLSTVLNTVLGTATGAINSLAVSAIAPLVQPAFDALAQVVTVDLNVQENDIVNGVYSEIPIQVALLGGSDILTLNLSKVTVGQNIFA